MPILSVVLSEGRSTETKRAFIRAITEATVQSLGVRMDQVRVVLNETPRGHFAIAGTTLAETDEKSG